MGCDAVYSCRQLPTFQGNMLPPSLGLTYTARGINWVIQTGCMEYGHSDPCKGVGIWSLVWANRNNGQENGLFRKPICSSQLEGNDK